MRAAFFTSLVFLVLGATIPARAATTVSVLPATGTPSVNVAVSGSGFGASEGVDVYVDLVDTSLLVSSSSGSIAGSVTIPASASPGTHYISAIGRHTGVAAQTSYVVTTPWNGFAYGAAQLGSNPFENTLSTGNVASAGTLWTNASNGGGGTVAVVGGKAYLGTSAGIVALSATTGKFVWRYQSSTIFYASPTISAGVLYIGGDTDDTFYALNATTSAKIWSTKLGSAINSSAAVVNGIVYVGCYDDKLYALSATTGAVLWMYTTGGSIDSSPAVVDGVVYFGSYDGKVYALNAQTGALLWSYTTGNNVESTPAVVDGVVYVGSDDDKVYALAARGNAPGSLLWSYATGNEVFGHLAVANGLVFAPSSDDSMYALNAQTGALVWSINTGQTVRPPIVANGVVYFMSQNQRFYAVNASSGQILATAITGSSFFGSPSISDGVVYLSIYGGNTYAISLTAQTNAARTTGPPPPASLHPDFHLSIAR